MDKQTIDAFLDKYWAGESSLEEEQSLRTYFSAGDVANAHKDAGVLFGFYNSERDIVASKAIKDMLPQNAKTSETKIRHFNWTRVAASIILIFSMLVGWNYFTAPTTNQTAAVEEISDPDEAYRVTMEALAYLSNKYDKGAKPLQTLAKVNATNILNN